MDADNTITNLKGDIRRAKGSLLAVEGMGDQWQTDQSRNNSGWEQKRFGASPPDAMVSLAAHASNEVFAACGLEPVTLHRSEATALPNARDGAGRCSELSRPWAARSKRSYARSSMPRTSFWGGTSYALRILPVVRGRFSRWLAPGWT